MRKAWQGLTIVVGTVCLIACYRSDTAFTMVRADHNLSGSSNYPIAVDKDRVGTYPPETKSGAGYFYDEVLAYRVWLHPERGAEPLNGTHDYFVAFAQYEMAEAFSKTAKGSEPPIVLVRQIESIDEPQPGHYVHHKSERITEGQVVWLTGNRRTPNSIEEFLKHPRPAKRVED